VKVVWNQKKMKICEKKKWAYGQILSFVRFRKEQEQILRIVFCLIQD
jgi:hypothetical protein